MSDRTCPQCGQPLTRFTKRCALCGTERRQSTPSSTGPSRRPRSPTESPAPPEDSSDVVLGPFKPDQIPAKAPASALVRIDLKAWLSNSRVVLKEHLHNLVIPQRWDNHVLGVFGAYLDQVVPIIREIMADLEPALDATDSFVLDTSDLEPAALEVLAKTLDESRVVFRFSDGVLSVARRDDVRATRILNDLRAGNLGMPVVPDIPEPDDDLQIEGEDHAFAALDALYQAVDAVRRHPDRIHEVDNLADTCARCPIGAPFGMEPSTWHDLVFEAGELAEASGDLDDDETRTRATVLYERLRSLVA